MNKVAHLETVTLDTKLATSKQLNADEILVNGEDVAEMFNREHTYREMETRVKLQPEDNYMLIDDNGLLVSANFRGMTDLTQLFRERHMLKEITQKNIDDWGLNDVVTANLFLALGNSVFKRFEGKLDNLVNFESGFGGNMGLEECYCIFPKLTMSNSIFNNCQKLTSVYCDFRNLKSSRQMFYLTPKLKNVNGNLDSLESATYFFSTSGIESFSMNLPSLKIATEMFSNCQNFTSFASKLKWDSEEYSSLTDGKNMFANCKLDAASVENILTQLQPFTDGSTHIMTMTIQEEAVSKFNEITGNTVALSTSINNVSFRGWTIEVNIK